MQAAAATDVLRPVQTWGSAERRSRVLYGAIVLSVLLHAALLAVHFKFAQGLRAKISDPPLQVVLVNAKTKEHPLHAEVLAQANLDGGGNTDLNRHAETPLPVTLPHRTGHDLVDAQRRVQQLEAAQRRLLTQMRKARAVVMPPHRHAPPAKQPSTSLSGRNLADLALATMRLQAQIDRNIDAYEKRPRKTFLGARARQYAYALYEEQWREKIERVGTLNYPSTAHGRLHGNLQLTVTLRPNGSVQSVVLDRSSGIKALDEAAFRIVRLAAPFEKFPPGIRKHTDLLVITRTWFFGRGEQFWTQ